MIKLIGRSTLLAFLLISPTALKAQTVEVTERQPLSKMIQLELPTSLDVSNAVGKIVIYKVAGSSVVLTGKYVGDDKALVSVEQPSAGQMKVGVKYPSGSGRGGIHIENIQNSNGSIHISGATDGIFISGGGSVVVNGRMMSAGSGGMVSIGGSGRLELHVGIPPQFLAHLKAKSESGSIEVRGQFQNEISGERHIIISSESGDVICESVCASGNIKAESQSGDVTLVNTRGNATIKTLSGDVTAVGNEGDISAESMSGGVSVSNHKSGHVNAASMSGDVRMNNPDPAVTEKANSISGKVRGLKAAAKSCSAALSE